MRLVSFARRALMLTICAAPMVPFASATQANPRPPAATSEKIDAAGKGEAPAKPAPSPAPAQTANAQLTALFQSSDDAAMARMPLMALVRGDTRFADRLGVEYNDAYDAREKAALEADLAALRRIDRGALSATNKIAYDVFESDQKRALAAFAPDVHAVLKYLPIDHFQGIHVLYPMFVSGTGGASFSTVADYENGLKRNAEYPIALAQAVTRMREGMKLGVVQPKLVVRNMIDQFDNLLAQGVEKSPYYGPVNTFPDGIGDADRVRLRAAYARQVRDEIQPAHKAIREFLVNTYLPAARDTVGLSALPNGAAAYARFIEFHTTLPMTADATHALGVAEVARITRALEQQKTKIGFTGTLAEFFTHLQTDKRFQPTSASEISAAYDAIGKRVDARVREQFTLVPKSRLVTMPVPAFVEKTSAAARYLFPTPDGLRPGIFYFNTYDLPSRYSWRNETLYLHEAVPGHHFQMSLAVENEELPAFIRFGGNNAFVEGWALYAETLYAELDVALEPYARTGGLRDEMIRAMRLVVDTGLHAQGWSRDRAIKYMTDNSPMPLSDATAEVERYIAMPGQALAYKIGQLTISRAKERAIAALGNRFDPRAFHAVVLSTGALPLPVLDKKVDDWIASQR